MLLTVPTTHRPAVDLDSRLHEHPGWLQRFPQPTGVAHVSHPEAGGHRRTAALLPEVDPVGLVRVHEGVSAVLALESKPVDPRS